MKQFMNEMGFNPELLSDFDHINIYKAFDSGMPNINHNVRNIKVGQVALLIRDMVDNNAPEHEVVRAFRYLMVVVDSEKHFLDYKRAYADLGIDDLLKTYPINKTTRKGEKP